VYSC